MRPPDPSVPTSPKGATAQRWVVLVAIFWFTSMVEGLGVSQVFAFLPAYLREMGVAEQDRLGFVGLFGSLIFVVGAPFVPLWGVWADKYSRKAVIVRSALVEAVVFAGIALSQEPWQLALSVLLIGLQLGNTGVMLAGIRDVTPRARLGTVIAIFGDMRDGPSPAVEELLRAFYLRGVLNAPMCRHRMSGPDRTHLARGAVADGDDQVHGRRLGLDPGFSILDAGDVTELFGMIRSDLGLHHNAGGGGARRRWRRPPSPARRRPRRRP